MHRSNNEPSKEKGIIGEINMTLTSTAKQDLKELLKETHKRGITKVDHSDRVSTMTDSEALGLLISVVKRTL